MDDDCAASVCGTPTIRLRPNRNSSGNNDSYQTRHCHHPAKIAPLITSTRPTPQEKVRLSPICSLRHRQANGKPGPNYSLSAQFWPWTIRPLANLSKQPTVEEHL